MKKSILAVVLLMSLLMVFCAACGSNTAAAEVSATMAPTDTPAPEPTDTPEPTATPEPEESAEPEQSADPEQTADANNSNSNSNNAGNSNTNSNTTTQATATPVQDKKSVAQGMVGQSVSSLTAAIGSPNSTEYTASCLVFDGEDGILHYDGFDVATVKYADGTELVMGLY